MWRSPTGAPRLLRRLRAATLENDASFTISIFSRRQCSGGKPVDAPASSEMASGFGLNGGEANMDRQWLHDAGRIAD